MNHDLSSARALRLAWLCPLALAVSLSVAEARAQDLDPQFLQELKALREEQARIAELQARNEAAIRALEARAGIPSPAPAAAAVAATGAPASAPAPVASTAPAGNGVLDRLKVSGDMRLRSQHDASDNDRPNRTTGQVRFRLGATYAYTDRLTLGARLDTGDNNDPNSVDAQLSNWVDDLDFSLDQVYAQLKVGKNASLYAGKFPQPFARTDLVWDGDVSPQGLAATWKHGLAGGGALRTNAMLFLVDAQPVGSDTNMGGLQFGYESPASGGFKYDAYAGYYHYSIGSMAGADSGDWRTNRLKPDGTFLSDFELFNVLASATWQGANEKWPVRVVGDYVRNLGAYDDQDTGFGVDLSLGRASKPGDWRLTYGYSQTDVDAVLAAFSHDNIGIATNYKLHALTVDYTPVPKTTISAIWYHYKPNDPRWAGSNEPGDWLDRFRLFFLMSF